METEFHVCSYHFKAEENILSENFTIFIFQGFLKHAIVFLEKLMKFEFYVCICRFKAKENIFSEYFTNFFFSAS